MSSSFLYQSNPTVVVVTIDALDELCAYRATRPQKRSNSIERQIWASTDRFVELSFPPISSSTLENETPTDAEASQFSLRSVRIFTVGLMVVVLELESE